VTERLYYTDSYCVEFEAELQRMESLPDGRHAAILDRTAFYPTSGGQPHDTGMLGGARVLEVLEREDGAILHVLDSFLPPGRVSGRIDWPRRFEHMQQHTGQHVLSAVFDRLAGARTVSFHLGATSSTIDLSREATAAEIIRSEEEANRVVWEDRPVEIRFADAAEAAALPLRKESAREGLLRLIDVEDVDLSACGGTHVARTGAIGVIGIAGWEKFRGGTRVEFLCGVRALRAYRTLRDTVAESIRLMSVTPNELPAGIERLQSEVKELKRALKDQQSRLASFDAAALADGAVQYETCRVVVQALDGWDANGLKLIATRIAERPGHVAVLFGLPAPAAVVVARAGDLALDAAAVLKQLTTAFGGKGGGRPELAQGGGLQAEAAQLIAAGRTLLESIASP
jgi:alanyl-tRNA synthetase